ncbi:hypothetical protein M5D96_004445 [Drosophila gunungcola]|uniref:Uncharacterized protein n=1 Tax=Drosophila gunungcola TaxID=103775 RepID=A0A9P9YU04_9MUSC|nr:hypothetical protein M5D96_004445 [Drosophila gunungcola]
MPLKRKTKLKNQSQNQQRNNTIKNTHNKRAANGGRSSGKRKAAGSQEQSRHKPHPHSTLHYPLPFEKHKHKKLATALESSFFRSQFPTPEGQNSLFKGWHKNHNRMGDDLSLNTKKAKLFDTDYIFNSVSGSRKTETLQMLSMILLLLRLRLPKFKQ